MADLSRTRPTSTDLCWPVMTTEGWFCDAHLISWPHEEQIRVGEVFGGDRHE